MKVEYSEDKKMAFFDGVKFRRDTKTGYYLATKKTYQGKRERLHVYVWRYFNGPVKDGCIVHHKDEDKGNNEIENLACIPAALHGKHHGYARAANFYDEVCKNLAENAIPKAAAWHSSSDGRKFHSLLGKKTMDERKMELCTCKHCGKTFFSKFPTSAKYCSNACKTAARVESGVDNETRICACCGGEFSANKYVNKIFCSAECRRSMRRNKSNQTAR